MRHRAEVARGHHAVPEGIRHHLLAQLAAELERPEERAVVVAPALPGDRLRGVRIGAHLRERLLEEVVVPDARHEEVEALLEAPVYLALPLLEAPVLGL
ncbi:hypothetical protein DCD76_19085, partial [Acinetobacter baumannii]